MSNEQYPCSAQSWSSVWFSPKQCEESREPLIVGEALKDHLAQTPNFQCWKIRVRAQGHRAAEVAESVWDPDLFSLAYSSPSWLHIKIQNSNWDLLAVLVVQCLLHFLFYSLRAALEILGDVSDSPTMLWYSNTDSLVGRWVGESPDEESDDRHFASAIYVEEV